MKSFADPLAQAEINRLRAKLARVEALAEDMHADAEALRSEYRQTGQPSLLSYANCTAIDARALRHALADREDQA